MVVPHRPQLVQGSLGPREALGCSFCSVAISSVQGFALIDSGLLALGHQSPQLDLRVGETRGWVEQRGLTSASHRKML